MASHKTLGKGTGVERKLRRVYMFVGESWGVGG